MSKFCSFFVYQKNPINSAERENCLNLSCDAEKMIVSFSNELLGLNDRTLPVRNDKLLGCLPSWNGVYWNWEIDLGTCDMTLNDKNPDMITFTVAVKDRV